MVRAAKRDGEFIADFQAKRARLSEAQMVRIRRLFSAQQARLCCHELQVLLVAQPPWLPEREHALVDTRSS